MHCGSKSHIHKADSVLKLHNRFEDSFKKRVGHYTNVKIIFLRFKTRYGMEKFTIHEFGYLNMGISKFILL